MKKTKIQAFNDGVLSIHAIKRGDDGTETLTPKHPELRYSEMTVGMARYYAAMQANIKIDLVARILRRDGITTQDIAVINGEQYDIRQVQRPKGVTPPCCDLTLEKVKHRYDEP